MEICDLLEEILEIIFDYLSVSDLKRASLVCLQWSRLAFSARRMDRIRFSVCLNYQQKNPLTGSQRQYRHIKFYAGDRVGVMDVECIQFLQSINKFVVSLDVSTLRESSQIKRILMEVPNLRVLTIKKATGLMQLPVFQQLSELNIQDYTSPTFETFDICTVAPNLQGIHMDCASEYALRVYRHFSHQLKSVKVMFGTRLYFDSFFEISFPELLDIIMWHTELKEQIFSANFTFLAGSKHLQRAKLIGNTHQSIVNSLVENCPNLTFLSIETDNLENCAFIGLANLTKLKVS